MKDRNKAVPAVYLILMRDDEILLSRRANTGYYDGWYGLPSGHVEYKELPTDALIRECSEEIDISLSQKELSLAHFMHRVANDETGDRVDMFFVSGLGQNHNPVNKEPEKCDELFWCQVDNLPNNMVQNVRQAVEKALSGSMYSELGSESLETYAKEFEDYRSDNG